MLTNDTLAGCFVVFVFLPCGFLSPLQVARGYLGGKETWSPGNFLSAFHLPTSLGTVSCSRGRQRLRGEQGTVSPALSNVPVPQEFRRRSRALDIWNLLRPTGASCHQSSKISKNSLVTLQCSQVTWGLVTRCPRGAGDQALQDPSHCLGPAKTCHLFTSP